MPKRYAIFRELSTNRGFDARVRFTEEGVKCRPTGKHCESAAVAGLGSQTYRCASTNNSGPSFTVAVRDQLREVELSLLEVFYVLVHRCDGYTKAFMHNVVPQAVDPFNPLRIIKKLKQKSAGKFLHILTARIGIPPIP
jgi:hypothetical protein